MLRQIFAIILKDFEIERNNQEVISGMVLFSILCLFIFGYALDDMGGERQRVIAAILWVTIVLSGTLGLNRTISRELENNTIDGLLLATIDRSVVVFGKLLGQLAFMLITELVLLLIGTLLFNVNLLHGGVLLVMIAGTYGYTAAGTLVSLMVVKSRSRAIVLPVVLLPLVLPLLFFAIPMTQDMMMSHVDGGDSLGLLWIVVYDLAITTLIILLAEFVLDA